MGRAVDKQRIAAVDGAEFLSRALLTRAIRQADAGQMLRGGAGVVGVVIADAEDSAAIVEGAGVLLRSSSKPGPSDWKVAEHVAKRHDATRRAGSGSMILEADQAARTIVVIDAEAAPSPWFEAMADGIVALGRPDWPLVAAAFRAVMGRGPARALPPELLAVIPLAAYGSAIRPQAGCARAIARLRRLAETRLTEKSVAKVEKDPRDSGPTIDDLHGLGAAGEWGKTLAHDLEDYNSKIIRWCDVDKGILLSSPSGSGKTTFALALGRTCNIPVHVHSLAAWQARGYLNDLLKAMREAFEKAKAAAPCILFIDEIDSFGDRERLRGYNESYNREVINALLECLDGAVGREGVIVVGATNHPEAIDAGIKRPGRLDRHIAIPLPDLADRIGILRYHLGVELEGVDLTPLAARLNEASGAMLEQIVRDGRRRARTSRRPVELADLEAGLPPMVRLSTEAFRRSCIHEAGHLLAGLLLASETSAVPIGATVAAEVVGVESGRTRFRRDAGFDRTLSAALAEAAVLLAGFAAERILLGEASCGSGGAVQSDLARATRLLAELELSHGLGDQLVFLAPASSPELMACLRHDTALRHRIDLQLRSCLDRSSRLLGADRAALVAIADTLSRTGRISAEEAARVSRLD